ncbi:hypothetical protein EDB81DRAFT_758813 [Dactylonectria macrodidyma]|uniref:Uncharacterized protein n=1 Tax=Dactylonectria macrodidyma TaxID=307937 RepID=A0A9P9EYE4_9HYPO|nr:hypothetical protein EDB81DRAFT_758813 [Dactylonectria macrodidyma]
MDIWGELEDNKTPHPHLFASQFGQVGTVREAEERAGSDKPPFGARQSRPAVASAPGVDMALEDVWLLGVAFCRWSPGRMDWGTEYQGSTLASRGEGHGTSLVNGPCSVSMAVLHRRTRTGSHGPCSQTVVIRVTYAVAHGQDHHPVPYDARNPRTVSRGTKQGDTQATMLGFVARSGYATTVVGDRTEPVEMAIQFWDQCLRRGVGHDCMAAEAAVKPMADAMDVLGAHRIKRICGFLGWWEDGMAPKVLRSERTQGRPWQATHLLQRGSRVQPALVRGVTPEEQLAASLSAEVSPTLATPWARDPSHEFVRRQGGFRPSIGCKADCGQDGTSDPSARVKSL